MILRKYHFWSAVGSWEGKQLCLLIKLLFIRRAFAERTAPHPWYPLSKTLVLKFSRNAVNKAWIITLCPTSKFVFECGIFSMLPQEAILITATAALSSYSSKCFLLSSHRGWWAFMSHVWLEVLIFACQYSVFRYLKGFFQFSVSVWLGLREQNYHIGFRKGLSFD